MRFPR